MSFRLLMGMGWLAASATAHPHVQTRSGASQRLDISKYALPSKSFYGSSSEMAENVTIMNIQPTASFTETASEFVRRRFPELEFRMANDHYIGSNGLGHVHFKQIHNGIDIDNADINVNIGRDGQIFSYGHSAFEGQLPPPELIDDRKYADPVSALRGVVKTLGLNMTVDDTAPLQVNDETTSFVIQGTEGVASNPSARLVYIASGDSVSLSWRIETDVLENWLVSYADATKPTQLHGVVDYVADATMQVFDWNTPDPSMKVDRKIVTDPWIIKASPFTWFSDGTKNYTTTRGNNGVAHINPKSSDSYENLYRPDSKEMKFEYAYKDSSPPKDIIDASVVQLWYTANMIHDQYYLLGFDEKAGNFQFNNNGKGGKDKDGVILNAQDGRTTNNAAFGTPPDGSSGRMYMYIWTRSDPYRDCSFDQAVVIHEYVHGLSNRLTGGPDNASCLQSGEAGGMGEGWSDTFAFLNFIRKSHSSSMSFAMGHWIFNNPKGIRKYPYSTDKKVNPLTYKNGDESQQVHFLGTIWATMLWDVMWNLIGKHGNSDAEMPTLDDKGVPTDGRFLTMKLLIDGMAIQPCRPDFTKARDAILDADKNLTGGANKCLIWKGFAGRGLGPKAATGSKRTEDFTMPSDC
ncbi:hypothetical protein VHEMI10399 [[Torrubiella] hemipterigena]|uniref:Extracellular metalloproteinase n=1 Tax=[Torrubiella] hemipterigena TaxID=1531966 RepID=A0A0A1TT75_9HYPO|nr:hypothetical protein VHEMI10399 [[Torrubiella] hemipterigena]